MELSEEIGTGKNDILGKIMLNVSSFPSMPQAAVKLINLLNCKDVQINKVEELFVTIQDLLPMF
jgi:HD-like signal output (HDOD) protein